MSDTTPQTAAAELLDRAVEHAPARTVPFLIALDNMRHMFALKQRKDREDYALEKQMLGAGTGGEVPSVEPEDMGDITVAGDTTTTIHNHYQNMPTELKPAEAGKEAPSIARRLLPLALATGLGAGGVWLASNWGNLPWNETREFNVLFYNADGEPIEVQRHVPKAQ